MQSIGPGCEIDGFRLGELMHIGSMASIYRLTGREGPLPLIMKIPRLGPGERAVNVIGFEVCRMVLGALAQSPHHPTLVAYGDIETVPYLVMELVEGARLDDWLQRAPLPPEEIARLGSALALALHDLHKQDVVHLDLKPTNVLYRASGEAVLVDFGLAHHNHFPDFLAEELRIPVGNWVYMAPEQIHGVRADPRSDIYALGGMLYELATGRMPFGRPRSVAELRRRLYRDPVPPRGIFDATPRWLQEVILHCLEVDAGARYASAEEVAFDLANPSRIALSERAARSRRAGWWTSMRRRLGASRHQHSSVPPPSPQRRLARVVAVALLPGETNEPLREAMRGAVRGALAAHSGCRIACLTAVLPSAAIEGEGEEATATGRHIRRMLELRHWAEPLGLPEERISFHVLEAEKPVTAIIDYVKLNEVDQLLIGASNKTSAARLFAGDCAQLVAQAPCNVTVVRSRTEC